MDDLDSPSDRATLDQATLDYQAQFDLPPDELLVDSFHCALQQGILHQGKLYVSQHFLCFYSNILLSEAKLVIRADRIEAVELAKVMIFPTAIRVVHSDGKEAFFASFLAREKCYRLLLAISKGEQIGRQRVKSSRELDRPKASATQREPTYSSASAPDKHQKILERADKPRKPRHSSDDDDVDADGLRGGRQRRSRPDDEGGDDAAASAKRPSGKEESTLTKLGNLLTSVHVSQAPKAAPNSIVTPHGVVVLQDNPDAILPTGAKFRHARTGSLAPGIDGPGKAIVAGGEHSPNKSLAPTLPKKGNRSSSHSPQPRDGRSPQPAAQKAQADRGSAAKASRRSARGSSEEDDDAEEEEEDRPRPSSSKRASDGASSSAAVLSGTKKVPLAFKPRKSSQPTRRRHDDEEDDDE